MEKPLRILMVVNLPWDARLGAVRIWMGLAKQWTKAGHTVERFCLTDAFPRSTESRQLSSLRLASFSRRAMRYVRVNGHRFDIIDALTGTLPFSKKQLRFDGLIVNRSVGVYRFYEDFTRSIKRRWPDRPRGNIFGRLFYSFLGWKLAQISDRSIRQCDLINVPNIEERQSLQNTPAGSKPVIVQPYGLNETDRAAFEAASQSFSARLRKKEICFVGMWSLRKGARDWPAILRAIWNTIPDARFAFLGTMTDEQAVLRDLGLSPRESIRCVTSYDPGQLPQLIGSCAVGLFPSYIEGFGISVIEQLAAGIPTIAYDVPGPRHIFADAADAQFLVQAGDIKGMADRAVEILRMNENDYAALSAKSRQIASHFRWEQIAADTIDQYAAALARVKSANQKRETEAMSA